MNFAIKSTATKQLSTKAALAAVAILLGLSGCGHDPGTRAATGAGIGVVGAAVLGAPLLAGAAVGAVAGAATTPEHHSDRDER